MASDNCPFKDGGTCTREDCVLWCPIESSCVQVCSVVDQRVGNDKLDSIVSILGEIRDYNVKYLPYIAELLEKIASK